MAQLTDYSDPNSFGSRMRRRRMRPLLELIKQAYQRDGNVSVLDLGGRTSYWHLLPEGFLTAYQCHVTIVNQSEAP